LIEEDVILLKISCESPREYAMLEFLYSTGCRFGEVQKLDIEDINLENCSAIVNGKGAKYPTEVRRLIYTTNAVEGFHRMLRKYTKTKTIYPTDDAVRKSVFLSIQEITKKWNMPVRDWGIIIGQLLIFFGDRMEEKYVG
jgi:site-specific recombinase XerD